MTDSQFFDEFRAPDHIPDATKMVASGESDPEYATAIFNILGITETWTNSPHWTSDRAKERCQLEELVSLIKTRAAKNAEDHQRMKEASEYGEKLFSPPIRSSP